MEQDPNSIRRRQRTTTAPRRPPKRRRSPSPPLDPVIPADDDPIPQQRGKGRPRGGVGPVMLRCPFASVSRDGPLCVTYPDPVEKGRVI
jgi:hypothetical protein